MNAVMGGRIGGCDTLIPCLCCRPSTARRACSGACADSPSISGAGMSGWRLPRTEGPKWRTAG